MIDYPKAEVYRMADEKSNVAPEQNDEYEAEVQRLREEVRPRVEAMRASSQLIAADLGIIINVRDD